MNKVYEILCYIASFQLLLFSVFLFTQKNGKIISNKILSLFFFAKGIAIIELILICNGNLIFNNYPYLFFIAGSFDFLFGPTLYLYVKSVIFNNFKLRKIDFIHLIPFISYIIFFLTQYHIYFPDIQRQIIKNGFLGTIFLKYILWNFFHAQVFFYIVLIIRLLFIYSNEIKNNYSNIKEINLRWLKIVIYGFISMWSFYLINHFIYIIRSISFTLLNLFGKLTLFGFSTFLIYKVLINPKIIPGINITKEKNGYKTISKDDLSKLTSYMKTEKPYLEPNLVIHELAERTSISQRKLSYIVNRELNKNFFDFINEYRINEAKELLLKPESSKKTILEILYESGFNSKSVFNSIFKKQTGYTPSEFKKNFLKNK